MDASAFSPLANIAVRVRGAGFEAKTTTDEHGHYSIRLPGAGSYEVTVVPSPGMAHRPHASNRIRIANAQQCMRAEFQLVTNGRISGTVVDEATGRPIPNLVLRAGDDLQESKTARSGTGAVVTTRDPSPDTHGLRPAGDAFRPELPMGRPLLDAENITTDVISLP